MQKPLTIAVRDANRLASVEAYDESDSRYLFVQPGLGVFVNRVFVGRTMETHRHPHYHQFIYVLEGRGEGAIGEQTVELRPGVAARIPADTPHAWSNTGDAPLTYLELKLPTHSEHDMRRHVELCMPGVDPQLLGIDPT